MSEQPNESTFGLMVEASATITHADGTTDADGVDLDDEPAAAVEQVGDAGEGEA